MFPKYPTKCQIHHFNVGIYASRNVCVKDIDSRASMVLQNYQKFIVLTSNMTYIVALGVGFKCPRKIHVNSQWGGDYPATPIPTALLCSAAKY